MHLGHFTVISLAENVTTLYSVVSFLSAKMVIMPSISKASPFLTGSVWPLSVTTAVHAILTTLKRSERGGSLMRLLSTDGPSHPENCWAQGVTEKMVECSLFVHSLGGHGASDASGEAGSEQGWSVVGPPEKHANKNSSLEPWAETR